MIGIDELRKKLEQKKGQCKQIKDDLHSVRVKLRKKRKALKDSNEVQAIIQAVAKQTQEELEYRITEPVSLAMSAVFDNPYKQVAEFKITGRGTTECHLMFKRGKNIVKPFEASGGGPVDVSAFALRLGSWSLSQPKSRPIIILDEPFRFVSKAKMPLAGQMLKESASQLGLQIIMVTHIDELVDAADKVFQVTQRRGKSKVEVK